MTLLDRRYSRLPFPGGSAFWIVFGRERDIADAYRNGDPLRRLAARYGVSATTIGRIVVAMGQPLRGRGGANNPMGKRSKLESSKFKVGTLNLEP